jgi:hypothetical protein
MYNDGIHNRSRVLAGRASLAGRFMSERILPLVCGMTTVE